MTDIIVPGYKGSPKGHWQYWLQTVLPNAITVQQRSWDFPKVEEWVEKLQECITAVDGPIRLIGHSMGAVTITFWAQKYKNKNITSAILVAPADSESEYLPSEIIGFSPLPRVHLPFKSTVIGSHTDPYMSLERVLYFANRWNADFIDAGDAGHINSESGYNEWPELLNKLYPSTEGNNLKGKAIFEKDLLCAFK